jgi:hypothetical protein
MHEGFETLVAVDTKVVPTTAGATVRAVIRMGRQTGGDGAGIAAAMTSIALVCIVTPGVTDSGVESVIQGPLGFTSPNGLYEFGVLSVETRARGLEGGIGVHDCSPCGGSNAEHASRHQRQ